MQALKTCTSHIYQSNNIAVRSTECQPHMQSQKLYKHTSAQRTQFNPLTPTVATWVQLSRARPG